MSFDQTDPPAFRVVRRGSDRVQVEKDLDSWEVDAGARQQAKTAAEDPASQGPYAAVSNHVAQVMQALDEEVERLLVQANEEVERMLSEARADADRFLNGARQQAGRVRSDLEHRRRSLYGKLRRSRNAVDEALRDLDSEIADEGPANEVILLLEDDGSEESVDG